MRKDDLFRKSNLLIHEESLVALQSIHFNQTNLSQFQNETDCLDKIPKLPLIITIKLR